MTVLVTGAAGFIGKRLVGRLLSDGETVRSLILPTDLANGLAGSEIVHGDICNRQTVQAACAGCDRIYHLAAVVGDWGPEDLFQQVNVEGTRNVLDAASSAGCRRVVMVSSIVVYGGQLRCGGCDEDTSVVEYGVSPYSRSKRASEELALSYDRFGRVPVTVVRPGNVYGPGSRIWVDSICELIQQGKAMLVNGGKGDATLAYVDNVVDVIARSAVTDAAAGRVYNANDGSGITWKQYFSDLAELLGTPPPTRSVPVPVAWSMALAMEMVWRLGRRTTRPLLTREAVTLLASGPAVPIDRARADLGYCPVPYALAMASIREAIAQA